MKKYFYKIAFVLMVAFLASCDDFGDINTDPINSTNMDPTNQLVNVQMKYSGDYNIALRTAVGITMPLLQQIGGTFTNKSGATYAYSESIFSLIWNTTYPNTLVNIIDAEGRTNGVTNKSNLNAMCRIMKVMIFSRLTDLYGDIPYSEAGKGYVSLIIYPKYDEQEDIYNDFFIELKEAHDQLDAANDAVPSDQFYAGDIAKWKKYANSLRLRYAMRLIKVNPTKAQSEAEAAFADGVMTSNDDICKTQHEDFQATGGSDYRGNGLSAALLVQTDPYRITSTMINLFKPENISDPVDPRLSMLCRCYYPLSTLAGGQKLFTRVDISDAVAAYYASLPDSNALSGYIGIVPGTTVLTANASPVLSPITINVPELGTVTVGQKDQRRQIANFLQPWNAPAFHITYSEVELLLAEAKFRGWNVGSVDADTHYKNGVRAAIEQFSLYPDPPSITGLDAFIASKNLETGKELEQINTQLYFTLLLNPIEGFNNWRRTGYPDLKAVGTNATTIPRRLQYPLNETEQNKENLDIAVSKITGVAGNGVDSYLNRVWWDKE